MPLGDICSGISFRYDDSIFVALAEPCTLTSAQYRHQQNPAMATCGQKKVDGVSRLIALLFLVPGEEEDNSKDGKKMMNEEVEDGDKEEKINCTTTLRRPFGRRSAVSITYAQLICMPYL